jgi:hypothetical protein
MKEPRQYRKLPVVIEAWQLTREFAPDIEKWCGGWLNEVYVDPFPRSIGGPRWEVVLGLETLHGDVEAHEGDWIAKGPGGDFWPVQNNIFQGSYEEIEQ